MAYCTKCQGEHRPASRIPARLIALGAFPQSFVAQPDIWPAFVAWLRDTHAELVRDVTDEDIRDNHGLARQSLSDLMQSVGTGEEFLIPRRMMIGGTEPLITLSEDPASSVAVGFPGDDHSMATVMWMVNRADAEGLTALLRERLGEPDLDAVTGADGAEHMQEAFEEYSVHTHRD